MEGVRPPLAGQQLCYGLDGAGMGDAFADPLLPAPARGPGPGSGRGTTSKERDRGRVRRRGGGQRLP